MLFLKMSLWTCMTQFLFVQSSKHLAFNPTMAKNTPCWCPWLSLSRFPSGLPQTVIFSTKDALPTEGPGPRQEYLYQSCTEYFDSSVFANSWDRIVLFGLRYSEIFHERRYSVFGLRKFFKNEDLQSSVFGYFSWTKIFGLRYSVKITLRCNSDT